MSPYLAIPIAFAALIVLFAAVWTWQLKSENAGMIDPIWAFSLAAIAVFYGIVGNATPLIRILIAVGGGIWGIRLGLHLWNRNINKPEDPRYHRFRQQWGAAANRNMFWFFELQTVISMVLSLAFAVPAWRAEPPSNAWIAIAVLIWLASVIGESLADSQLRRFKENSAHSGEVCRVGLWRYSRHPNYFFECLHWVAYVALAMGSSWAWLTLLAPILMAWLLMKLSGVPMLEAHLVKSRPGYAEYMRDTSPLIPWPPRRG